MASNRFYGKVGYLKKSVEVKRGVFEDRIIEVKLYGNLVRTVRGLETESTVNPNTRVNGQTISLVADSIAEEHFHAIRYVEMWGVRWSVSSVTVEPPRLVVRLGGEYNGRTGVPTPSEQS